MRLPGRRRGAPSQSPPSVDDHGVPIAGYDGLKDKEVVGRLSGLSQAELAAVASYERSHKARGPILDKLRYLRSREPLKGYDALPADAIVEALAGAEAASVKAIRNYERKFQGRREILDEAARVLPHAPLSATESRLHDEKATRVREGVRKSPGANPRRQSPGANPR
jgi:hypothetical protein